MAKKKTENENPLAEETVEIEVVEETVTEETHDESQGKAGDEAPTVQETTEETLKEETVEIEVVEETVTEETHDESQGKAGDEAPTVQETTEETLKEETVEIEVVEETKPEPVAKEQDIPEDVLKTLAIFPEMEFLYVGKGGGIWRNGTPESIRGKAVLYKNPYFKNNKTEK